MSLSRLGLSLGIGGGTAATSSGAPLAVAASSNGFCCSFDELDTYIDLGTDSSLEIAGSNHSVSLWFRHTSSSNSRRGLLTLGNSVNKLCVHLGKSAPGTISYTLSLNGTLNAQVNAGSGLNDGNWHHFAATVTGGTTQIYVDGSAVSATTGSGLIVATYNRIGDGHYGNYGGDLDSIAIFTSALSSSDISAIYSAGRNGALGSYSPTSWWKMGDSDSGAGTTLTDEVGSNTGTLTNGAYFTSALNVAFPSFSIGDENSSFVGAGFDRDLFDGSAASSWYAWNGSSYVNSGWLGQDFGAGNEKTIVKYRMITGLANLTYPPKDWTFEGSADSASWTVLDTQTGVTDWEQATTSNYAEKWKEYTFSNSTAYRYYRLNVSANNGNSLLILPELEMHEE